MEDIKQYEGPERRENPRFQSVLSAFLRLSVIREGNPTIVELGGETGDISLEGAKLLIPEQPDILGSNQYFPLFLDFQS